MSSAMELTVKALVEFESELDRAKAEATEARKKASKEAADWAEAAKATAISRAQDIASRRVAKAKEDAGAEAEKIRKKGEADLKSFETSISKRKSEAAKLVTARLLGDIA